MSYFDIGIIGGGVSGVFAAHRLATEFADAKCIMFDIGRPQGKRRQQLCGWLGVLPNSDGKLYLQDMDDVAEITGTRKANASFKLCKGIFGEVSNMKVVKDRRPNVNFEKQAKKHGYALQSRNYYQLYPNDIHALSKVMVADINASGNIVYSFDNEVLEVNKSKDMFLIQTERAAYQCKKIIVCTGRSGWRWASNLYQQFDIVQSNDKLQFGVRIEMPTTTLKELNKSSCILRKSGKVEIGPFSWNGTVIPEDHGDLAISAFRSNESRWKTDKVAFQVISEVVAQNHGFQQTDRIGKLTFILANDRILKERVSTFLQDKSRVSIIPEYQRVKEDLLELGALIPEIRTKAYMHVPTILPMPATINIAKSLETDIEGMFVAGESAGVVGLLAAATMGIIAANEIVK